MAASESTVAVNGTMGCKVDDAVLSERCTLERRFAGIAAEMDVHLGGAGIFATAFS